MRNCSGSRIFSAMLLLTTISLRTSHAQSTSRTGLRLVAVMASDALHAMAINPVFIHLHVVRTETEICCTFVRWLSLQLCREINGARFSMALRLNYFSKLAFQLSELLRICQRLVMHFNISVQLFPHNRLKRARQSTGLLCQQDICWHLTRKHPKRSLSSRLPAACESPSAMTKLAFCNHSQIWERATLIPVLAAMNWLGQVCCQNSRPFDNILRRIFCPTCSVAR